MGEETAVARAQTRYARQTNWSTRRMSAAGRSRPASAWRDPHRWALSAAQVLPQLRHSYPDLRLYLREEQTARVLEMFGRGRVDGGIIALPYLTGDLETMLLGEDPLLVASSEEPRLRHPRQHRRRRADGRDFDAAAGRWPPPAQSRLTACRLLPGQPNEELQGTSLSTLVQMVGNGLGLTLILSLP